MDLRGGRDRYFVSFSLDSAKSLEYKFLHPLELRKSGKEGKERKKKTLETALFTGTMSGIHPREKYSLENRRRLLGLPLARNPQDRPFSLLHSLFPIHQAFVTVIQIPIVIYVDINGNPSSCRCSSAILLHPSSSPYHRKDTLLAPTLPPPRPDIMLY